MTTGPQRNDLVLAATNGDFQTAIGLLWDVINESVGMVGFRVDAPILRAGDGTEAAPSMTFEADADTGIYRVGTNSLALVVGGKTALTVHPDGSVEIPERQSVGSLADLKALSSSHEYAYLTDAGREGRFIFRSGDYSAEVTADPEEGIYIAPDSDATGASGAWVRDAPFHVAGVNAAWFGAGSSKTATQNHTAIQAALDTRLRVFMPPDNVEGSLTTYLFDYPLLIPNGGGFVAGQIRSLVRLQPTIASPAGNEIVYSISTEFDEFRRDDTIISASSAHAAAVGECIKADTTGGGFTITLPADPADLSAIKVKKVSSDMNLLKFVASGTNELVMSGVTEINMLHQNFFYLRFYQSINRWLVEKPQSVETGDLWLRGNYTNRVRGIKLEGAQFWKVGSIWAERFNDNIMRVDSVSDPLALVVIKNANWCDFEPMFLIDCPTVDAATSVALYVGGTESHLAAGGSRGNAGSADNHTFKFCRLNGADIGLLHEAGNGGVYMDLNLNNNRQKGGVCRFFGTYFAMIRAEVNGDMGFHFEDLGDDLTRDNTIAKIHNGGGQTELVVDDTGRNEWPYVDSTRHARHIPESMVGLETGDTGTMIGSFGRDAAGFRMYGPAARLSGTAPVWKVEHQGADVDSVRATHALRSTIQSYGAAAEWGFFDVSGSFIFKNAKTNADFVFEKPVKVDAGQGVQADKIVIPAAASKLTVSTGAITVTGSNHAVDTEGSAATDDLDTINGGVDGQLLVLRGWSSARQVTVKDGTGNINPAGDFTFLTGRDRLSLIYDASGGFWYELSRVTN